MINQVDIKYIVIKKNRMSTNWTPKKNNQILRSLRKFQATFLILSFALSLLVQPTQAEDVVWPQFRGPGGNALALGQSIPNEFGPDKNVIWKTALPSGHSSPVIWGNKIFLSGHVGTTVKMICLSRTDGKILWEQKRKIPRVPQFYHINGSVAASSAATDGEQVCFYFDDYGLVTTDLNGDLLWEHKFAISTSNLFSYGASPIIDAGKVLLNRDGAIDSCLICFDIKTGKEVWKAKRPNAINSYCSPYILKTKTGKEVLQGGSGELVAYDSQTGKEVWKATGLTGFVCPSPVADKDTIYFGGWTTAHVSGRNLISSAFPKEANLSSEALVDVKAFYKQFDLDKDGSISKIEFPESRLKDVFTMTDQNKNDLIDMEELDFWYKAKPLNGRNIFYAIKTGGKGDITKTHVKWEVKRGLPYVCSPLVQDDKLYLVKKGGFVSCINTKTGKPFYKSERLGLGGEYYATPISVGNKILIAAQRGTVFLIKPSEEFEILASNKIGENISATPAIIDNTIYLRGEKHLWAFRESK